MRSHERDQRERSRGRNPASTFPKLNFPDFKKAFEKDGSMGSESGRSGGGVRRGQERRPGGSGGEVAGKFG